MNSSSEYRFWVEFHGGKLILHGRSIEVATMFLDRVVTLEDDDNTLEKAIEDKFGGKCIVIHMPVDQEWVDKQLIFKIKLKTPIRREFWFLKKVQRDLAIILRRVNDAKIDGMRQVTAQHVKP